MNNMRKEEGGSLSGESNQNFFGEIVSGCCVCVNVLVAQACLTL